MRRLWPGAVLAVLLLLSLGLNVFLYQDRSSSDLRVSLLEADLLRSQARGQDLQRQLDDLRTRLAAGEDESRRLRAQVSELQKAATATPIPVPAATPSPAATPRASTQDLLAGLQKVEEATSRLRGLKPKGEVTARLANAGELGQIVEQKLEESNPSEELQTTQKLLVTLGLLSPTDDLHSLLLGFYKEQVVGLYDDDSKRLYVLSSAGGLDPMSRVILSHEYTHGLQDQYYDLRKLLPKRPENEDQALAVSALAEGDASLDSTKYAREAFTPQDFTELAQEAGKYQSPLFQSAPLILRREALFPYVEGLIFVRRLYSRGGWAAVDAAFPDPPSSTAQVIDPALYFAHRDPAKVEMPDLAADLGPGWKLLKKNILGELDISVMLEQYNPSEAESVSAGWAGDRYEVLENADGEVAVALLTQWSTPEGAQKFLEAYEGVVAKRFGESVRETESGPTSVSWAGEGHALFVGRQGTRVLVVIALKETTARQIVHYVGGFE